MTERDTNSLRYRFFSRNELLGLLCVNFLLLCLFESLPGLTYSIKSLAYCQLGPFVWLGVGEPILVQDVVFGGLLIAGYLLTFLMPVSTARLTIRTLLTSWWLLYGFVLIALLE